MLEGSTPGPQDPIATVLGDLWAKRRPEVVSDLGKLLALVEDAVRTPRDRRYRDEAIVIAHRLHGALGVFGWTTDKDRLADIETRLRNDSEIAETLIAAVESALRELPR